MSASPEPGLVVGVDVGGTFTDVFALDERNGEFRTAKVPSSRSREAEGFLRALSEVADGPAEVATLIHGTTVGTNALLERKAAPAGLITTRGFRDVLEMRRRDRPNTWGLWGDFKPMIPRDRRLEVNERVLADGSVLAEVNPAEVKERALALLESGAEACCVAFLHSYANPVNEHLALAAVREVWPNEHVTASADILPEIREFERTSTAVLNACLQPVVSGYLASLEAGLAEQGFAGRFFLVQSNGGMFTAEAARSLPVRTALSGPAAGVTACSHIAAAAGVGDVITCDMGGTSFDVAVITEGRTITSVESSIDFGLVIRTPMIEISTIGAGGGSIARVDAGGLLRVGPESAGSMPGPACYGSGEHPTVTDAHLVLGRINGNDPIGGLDPLDTEAARRAISSKVGDRLNLNAESAAEAVIEVATSAMAGAIRLVSIERGLDPARFTMVSFGGAGALHACKLVQATGLHAALIPPHPGVASAFGCVTADVRHDLVQTVNLNTADINPAELRQLLESAEERTREFVSETALASDGVDVIHEFHMAYENQTHTVKVHADSSDLGSSSIKEAFKGAYAAAYGRVLENLPIRLESVRTAATGKRPKFDFALFAPPGGRLADAHRRERNVYLNGEWRKVPVYSRGCLPAGASLPGPAILEQPDTTTVVEEGFTARVDEFANLILEPSDPAK